MLYFEWNFHNYNQYDKDEIDTIDKIVTNIQTKTSALVKDVKNNDDEIFALETSNIQNQVRNFFLKSLV